MFSAPGSLNVFLQYSLKKDFNFKTTEGKKIQTKKLK